MDKDEVEDDEGAWEGRLCKEIGGERVDVHVVQKPPSEVAATADEEGAFTWAPASGAERVEVGARMALLMPHYGTGIIHSCV